MNKPKKGDFVKFTNQWGEWCIVEILEMPKTGRVVCSSDDGAWEHGKVINSWGSFNNSIWSKVNAYNTPLYKVLNGE